jgi:hypothetical protein
MAIAVGPRTLAMAQRVVHQVVGVLAPDCVPVWLSDGFKGYLPAIVGHFGLWGTPSVAKTKARGPSHTGCRCLAYSMRRSSSSTGVSVWLGASTGWYSAPGERSNRSWLPVAGRSIPPL